MELILEGSVMEAVRGYLRELRVGRKVSQEDLADAIGLSRRALIDWENGKTEDIKTGIALKAIQYLQGFAGDLAALIDATVERGVELARQRLAEPPIHLTEDQQNALQAIANAVPEEQVDEVIALLSDLQRRNKTKEWVSFGHYLKGGGS